MTVAADARSRFYVIQKLSGKMGLTKAGFLLCEAVPIARTGSMVYGPGETDVETGNQGYALIDCEPEDLFKPETIASFNGVPFLDEHPENEENGVDPDNWQEYARGVVLNPRRGGPGQENELLADILVTVKDTIQKVMQDEKREVSCGYDADYEQLAPGKGRKVNIIGNHVALVGDGRCGKKCSIVDHLPGEVKRIMKKQTLDGILKKFKDALKKGDTAGAQKIMDDEIEPAMTAAAEPDDNEGGEGGSHTHIHLHQGEGGESKAAATSGDTGSRVKFTDDELENRFKKIDDSLAEISNKLGNGNSTEGATDPSKVAGDTDFFEGPEGYIHPVRGTKGYSKKKAGDAAEEERIEGELEEEAPPGTGDRARKATDSQYLEESFNDTVALAEILAPGVKLPTFDKSYNPRLTYDNICRLRKKALTQALGDEDTASLINTARGGRMTDAATIKKMTCDSARVLFMTAANAKREANNGSAARTATRRTTDSSPAPVASIGDLNKRNAEFYGRK